MTSPLLTASRLRAFRACPRLHRFKYELGYRAIRQAAALRFGTLVHAGLEAWWLAKMAGGNCLVAAIEAIRGSGEADPFDLVRAEELLLGYTARWEGEAYEVLAVEEQFECALMEPSGIPSAEWRLAGKLDAIVRCPDGLVRTVEHKTSSSDIEPGSDYWKRLRLDSQISIYHAGAMALGHTPAGCIYDVLGKVGLKPYQANSKRKAAETPEEYRLRVRADIEANPAAYYQRAEVVRLEAEQRAAMVDVFEWSQRMLAAEAAGQAPRNDDNCFSWNRPCDFFPICGSEASLDDEAFERLENVHPELEMQP